MVDSLDSGSSVHCGRAGSSPASPTKMRHQSWYSVYRGWCSFYFRAYLKTVNTPKQRILSACCAPFLQCTKYSCEKWLHQAENLSLLVIFPISRYALVSPCFYKAFSILFNENKLYSTPKLGAIELVALYNWECCAFNKSSVIGQGLFIPIPH